MKDKPDVGLLVFVNSATLEHKKRDGLKEDGNYVFWYGSKVPKRIVNMIEEDNTGEFDRRGTPLAELIGGILEDRAIDVTDYDFRLYFQVDGKIRGYFKITAIKYSDRDYELRFWSDDWIEIKDGEIKKGHQGWEYYPKPLTTEANAS